MKDFNLNMYEAFNKLDCLYESMCRNDWGAKVWYFDSASQIKNFIVNNVNGFTGIRVLTGEDVEGTMWFLAADAHELEHESMRETVISKIGKLTASDIYCIGYPDAAAFNDANFELENDDFIHDSDFYGHSTTITQAEYAQIAKEDKDEVYFEVVFKYPTFSVVGTTISPGRGRTLATITSSYKNSALGRALGKPQKILVQMTDESQATCPGMK